MRRREEPDEACRAANRAEQSRFRANNPGYSAKFRHAGIVAPKEAPCEICGRVTKLTVHHNHACCPGEKSCGLCFLGFLCDLCNAGLGHFRDDPVLLRKALEWQETVLEFRRP